MNFPFFHHLNAHFPYLSGAKILIAVSGGVDSVVLTDLCKKAGLNIALAHCNFNLRETESKTDQEFVVEMAERMNLEVFVEEFDTLSFAEEHKISVQMAARELRYQWFEELRQAIGFDYIFTAHHANDNLETFLINLSRGTGLDGLTGIPETNGFLLRPLLPFSRIEIEEYAQLNKLIWREDSSNTSTKYLRNQIRLEVIPKLMEMNPHLLDNFNKTVNHLQQSSDLVEDYISALFGKVSKKEPFGYSFLIQNLQSIPNLRGVLYELFKSFGFTQWDDIYDLLEAQSGKIVYSSTHRLIKDRGKLLLTTLDEPEEETYELKEGEKTIELPIGTFHLEEVDNLSGKSSDSVILDKKKLKFPLTFRKWREGDFFYPSGMEGKKKLSKFFKDKKLSLPEKEVVWLLCSEGKIVWVIGYRADERFTGKEKSTSLLKINYL